MLRNFIIFVVTFVFSMNQYCLAVPQNNIEEIKKYIKDSGLSRGNVTVRQLLKKSSSFVNSNDKNIIGELIKAFGDKQFGQFEFKKISNGSEEDIELVVYQGKQQYNLIFHLRGNKFATLKMQMDGTVKSVELSPEDMELGLEHLAYKISGVEKKKEIRLLTYKQIQKLNDTEKSLYFKQLQNTMKALEDVQNAQYKQNKSVWNLLIDEVFAVDGNTCICAGYVVACGQKFPCENAKIYVDNSQITCDPKSFGDNVHVSLNSSGYLPSDTTAQCEKRSGPFNVNKYSLFKDIKDQKSYDVAKSQLELHMLSRSEACEKAKVGKYSQDQVQTCHALSEQLKKLDKSCEDIGKLKGFKCGQSSVAGDSAGSPVVGVSGAGMDGAQQPAGEQASVAGVAQPTTSMQDGDCYKLQNLINAQNILGCTPTGARRANVTCQSGSETKTYNYCECGPNEVSEWQDGYASACKDKSKQDEKERKERAKKDKPWYKKDWFLKFALPLALVAGVATFAYKSWKKSNDKLYEFAKPKKPKFAPPPNGDTIVPRSTPGQL